MEFLLVSNEAEKLCAQRALRLVGVGSGVPTHEFIRRF